MSEIPINTPWKDASLSTSVECSPEVAENLRMAALDGLFALPRIGMGVGGFLLGSRHNGHIRITGSMEIPCAHSDGPGFALNDLERKTALELASSVRSTELVGCYFSKTRGQATPGEQDTELVRFLCPEPWQIALLLRPSTVDAFQVNLLVKGSGNGLASAGIRTIEPLEKSSPEKGSPEEQEPPAGKGIGPAPVTIPAEEPAIFASAVKRTPVVAPLEPIPAPPVALRVPVVKSVAPHAEAPVATASRLPAFSEGETRSPAYAPLPAFLQPPPASRFPVWIVVAALLMLALAVWLTRYSWLPRPPLGLAASDTNGRLSIRWNPDAVRGLDGGLLSVADGGETHPFPLSQTLLERGTMSYDRKSGRVTVLLRAGDTREITSFIDPTASKPAEPAKAVGSPGAIPKKRVPVAKTARP